MEAREITDISELLKIVPIEIGIMKKEPKHGSMSLRDKITWLEAGMNNKSIHSHYEFKIYFMEKDGELVGFVILSVLKSVIKYFDEIRVYRVWQKDPEVADCFWKVVKELGEKYKIKKIKFEVNRPAMERLCRKKYNMRSVSINMEGKI